MVTTPQSSPPRCRAMTLVELTLCTVLAVAVMGSLSLVSASLRNDTAEQQTRQTLGVLRQALLHYRQAHEQWVVASAGEALETLLADRSTVGAIESLPLTRTPQGLAVLDGYGRPLGYLAPVSGGVDGLRDADFVSAGADGRFGDPASTDRRQRSAAIDNLYGADTEGPTR